MSKNVKILFTLSVILNVLLLGAAGGFAYKKMQGNPWMEMKRDMAPETQAMMSESFKGTWKEMKPLIDDARKARADLKDVLMQDEFNAARYDEVMARLSKAQQNISSKKIAATKELVSKLKPEERRKMADWIVKAFEWRGAKRHGGYRNSGHRPEGTPQDNND